MTDPNHSRRRRLLYRSRYTGCKETDLWLGAFADRHLAGLSARQLAQYERLLEQPDGRIYAWLSGRDAAPLALDEDLEELILDTSISL